jgi:hypothetical protein
MDNDFSFDDVYTGPSPVAPTMGYDLIPKVALPTMAAALPLGIILGAIGMHKLMRFGKYFNKVPHIKIPKVG